MRAFSATLLIGNSYFSYARNKLESLKSRDDSAALALPKGWGLDSVLGEPAELQLQLADLERFEDKHNDELGFHARNIMAVAPEVCVSFSATELHASARLLRMTAFLATPAHAGRMTPNIDAFCPSQTTAR